MNYYEKEDKEQLAALDEWYNKVWQNWQKRVISFTTLQAASVYYIEATAEKLWDLRNEQNHVGERNFRTN